jgi:hypothetical protein
MCRRESSTASFWNAFVSVAFTALKRLPTEPFLISASPSLTIRPGPVRVSDASWFSWPTFSSTVIWATRALILASSAGLVSSAAGARTVRTAAVKIRVGSALGKRAIAEN